MDDVNNEGLSHQYMNDRIDMNKQGRRK